MKCEQAPTTDEHLAAHNTDLTRKLQREKSLAVCVAENCPDLVARCADGITDPHRAWQVGVWIGAQLDTDLPRVTRGRLLTALARASAATGDGDYIRANYDWVVPHLASWGPCTATDRCDWCADPEGRTCRY